MQKKQFFTLAIKFYIHSNAFPFFFLQLFEECLRPDTSLVSIMFVNNEIGVRQPIEEIGELTLLSSCLISPLALFLELHLGLP